MMDFDNSFTRCLSKHASPINIAEIASFITFKPKTTINLSSVILLYSGSAVSIVVMS